MRLLVIAVLAVAGVAVAPAVARAYPQFQLSQDAPTCSSCHYAPAGSGLLTDFGRYTEGELVSRGGDPEFLGGAVELPDWLQLGGNFRSATGVNRTGGESQPAVRFLAFPMQAEINARVGSADGKGFSAAGVFGLRSAARPYGQDVSSFLQAREHYLMWKQSDGIDGLYVRVGRFGVPYGLRLAEHPAYTRRHAGTPLWSETYAASLGWTGAGFEVHATGFIDDPLRWTVERSDGGALYIEKRLGTRAIVGVQGRHAISDDDVRSMGGVIGKLWFDGPRVLIQAEGDVVRQDIDVAGAEPRTQLVGYLLTSWFVRQGWMLDVGLGHFDEDIAIADLDRDAIDVNLHYFPWAHWEFLLTSRVQTIGLGSGGDTSGYFMFQAHYRL